MANLYEINAELERLYENSVNEDGEIDEAALAQIESLELDRSTKIDNLACLIKNLTSDAEAIKAEADKLTKRAKAAEARAKRLKEWLMLNLNGQKFSSPRAQVYYGSTKAVVIDDDAKLGEGYIKETVVRTPDKAAIKAAIEAGTEVAGAHIESKQHIVVK